MQHLVYLYNVSYLCVWRILADKAAIPRMSHDDDSDSELEDEENKDERISRMSLGDNQKAELMRRTFMG